MLLFNHVTKSFYPGSYGVFDFNFLIKAHEAVVFTGKSGAGKTTIMKLLIKEYLPTEGEIYLDGQAYSKIKPSKTHLLRRKIGVVFQDFLLINEMTVAENIALPLEVAGIKKKETQKRVQDLIKLVELEEKTNLFPSQLSGGEAGRVSIARTLALAPEVIFADEPTGNLDPKTSLEIAKVLKKINELGTTLLLATHDPIIVDVFKDDRIIKLEKGKIVADSKPHDVDKVLSQFKKPEEQGFFKRLFTKKPKTKKPKENVENKKEVTKEEASVKSTKKVKTKTKKTSKKKPQKDKD